MVASYQDSLRFQQVTANYPQLRRLGSGVPEKSCRESHEVHELLLMVL